ncbi:hemerythrin HHE cation binding domain-containing protein [Paraphoma chrysanthemicola]|nr:hemerythrin HHE cation binding domain-containing protein [Paraphoma chrysanthemicola]
MAILTEKPQSSKQTFSWETTPMSLIPTPAFQTSATDVFTAVASEMALVHNCIIRALNSIYLQAPHVPASQHANFVAYSLAVYQGLMAHHDGEEHTFFPELEELTGETGLMDENVEGHRAFDTKLGQWGIWLETCKASKQSFDAAKCVSMMDSFIPSLHAHLVDEIPTLLALSRFPALAPILPQKMEEEGKKVMGAMSKTEILPVFLLNHDVGFEGARHNFPPLPPPVKWVLREVCGRWNAAWWQFATCGFDGRAREVKFLGK